MVRLFSISMVFALSAAVTLLAGSPDGADHWSFRPILRPELPDGEPTKAAENAIDAFLLDRLDEKGIRPAAPASKQTLIRRATFDLHGLPSAPDAVDDFLADDAPDAYARRVDRLLASPRYGERWGRHWLDVVRFAQSNGYERDGEKPNAWRYRDYVIRSLNDDKPYDRFVLEQLAGDELADVSFDSIIATGFYRLGVWDDEPDVKLASFYDDYDDILSTTGTAFLGLTVGCARCHDHKFDPFSQEDYYSLLAFFHNIAPFGKDSPRAVETHFVPNPDAIFTPLVPPEELADWQAIQSELERVTKDDALSDEDRKKRVEELEKKRSAFGQALSVREIGPEPRETRVFQRGNPLTPGKPVTARFPVIFGGGEPTVSPAEPSSFRERLVALGVSLTTGLRRPLAEWIARRENPLTARVIANRLWKYHFGSGIVATPNDFGRVGTPPSHPLLLDWLASELIDGGWRLKRMHRMILLTDAYQRSSRTDDGGARSIDPENNLLWRQNMRRLEAEAMRDAVLAVSGQLNLEMGGRGVFPALSKEVLSTQSRPGKDWDTSTGAEQWRRSVYVFVKRTLGVPFLETFDAPPLDTPQPDRPTTTIAPQALVLTNSEFIESQSHAFAERLQREAGTDLRSRIEHGVRLALGRPSQKRELETFEAFVDRQREGLRTLGDDEDAARFGALQAFCKLVLNLNEFVYVD